jgi:hypothetical protein
MATPPKVLGMATEMRPLHELIASTIPGFFWLAEVFLPLND